MRGNPTESRQGFPRSYFADGREEPLEGGLSRAVEPPHGKAEIQGTFSVVFGMVGIIRIRRHG